MNFSEHTLISFGDSFTFGQDTVPSPGVFGKFPNSKNTIEQNRLWKLECNKHSYTQFIADNLGFKNSINFGVLGGSNDRSIALLETFLRSNPTLKVFVLFNFTASSRFMLFPKLNENHEYFESRNTIGYYDCVDVLPHGDDLEWTTDDRYTGINARSISIQYTYWRNSIQDVYNHVKDRRMLYYMLSSYNVPYATFDGVNDMDYRILRDNPIQYISSDGGNFTEYMYNENGNEYIFKQLDFLQSYYTELVDKTPLLAHINIEEDKNLIGYVNRLGMDYGGPGMGDINHYISEYGSHWSIEGHIEVAKLIENFIKKEHDN
jgi:hypothetical protein|tara:strand:+ start:92 stop:1048 length:957 start_codon:yes stop_codon:yes gene_type:complete